MNNKGFAGFVFLLIFFIVVLVLFATIEPQKETLDNIRGYANTGLNCPGTIDFNQTAYDSQTAFDKLNYRSTCFVTGISMVWFVGTVLIFGLAWVVSNWRGK